MKSQYKFNDLEQDVAEAMPLEAQTTVLFEVVKNVLDEGALKARTIKYKLEKFVNSKDIYSKIYALNKIVSDGKGIDTIPTKDNIHQFLEETNKWIAEALARRYIQTKIENEVEQALLERQDKYIDEIRIGIIKKQKGPENAKTLKKYADLEVLDSKKLTKNVLSELRPESFNEILGQERAIKSLIAKMASPFPQHIILYGPPGVGKTTAARLALQEAKN